MKKIFIGILFSCIIYFALSFKVFKNNLNLHEDFIKDSGTAEKIAEVLWTSHYGVSVLKQKPYNITLVNNVWIVKAPPIDELGGEIYIEIKKYDGQVLKMYHEK